MQRFTGRILQNQYRVEEFIAAGGMGAVYLVLDLKRNVPLAMKVLHEDLAEDPSIFKRFKREARALQKLAHPNIVPFYGLRTTENLAFLLESYIDGPSLKQITRHRRGEPMPIQEALIYLKALSSALGYAHIHDVVHCDVKPGNVMVDRGGAIYLTDFGIARHAESTTTTLGFAGTAAYMAPEQCRGEAVTAQTDVYALGVMLYELLTGRRPFLGDEKEAESGGSTGSERVRYAHIHLPPPDPLTINAGLSQELGEVLLKALAKKPGDRYSSVQEFFQAACNAVGVLPGEVSGRAQVEEELIHWSSNVVETQQESGVPSPAPAFPQADSIPEKIRQWALKKETPKILVLTGLLTIIAIVMIPRIIEYLQSITTGTATATATITVGTVLPTVGSTQTSTVLTTTPTPRTATPTETNGPRDAWRQGKLAFVADTTGQQSLYSMDLAAGMGPKLLAAPPSDTQFSAPSWSPDGTRLALSIYRDRLLIIDGSTGHNILTTEPCNSPTWAPDGTKVICKSRRGSELLFDIIDANSGDVLRTLNPSISGALIPAWSPTGNEIAFSSIQDSQTIIWRISFSDVSPTMMAGNATENYAPAWSPDGQRIAYQSNQGSSNSEIWIMDRDGQNARRITHTNGGWSRGPTWSPDGNWIAFVSNQNGSRRDNYGEVFIVSVDGAEIYKVTETGGHVYEWRVSWAK